MTDYHHSELRKRVMSALRGQQIYVPAHPGAVTEEQQFPKDITKLSDLEVRQLMSFWTAQLGYVTAYHSRCAVDLMSYKRSVKDYERSYRAANKQKNDKAWEVDAGLADDSFYQSLYAKYEQAEAMTIVTKSLRDTMESYYNAASREMTARMSEQGRDMSRRSGA